MLKSVSQAQSPDNKTALKAKRKKGASAVYEVCIAVKG